MFSNYRLSRLYSSHRSVLVAPHRRRHRRCPGFTAIEFVTSVGIIFILMSILIPAIFRTREAARASQCQNNLKQLSLGLHNYHDAHRTFPPGYISIMGIKGQEIENEWAWGAFLLPYLDQAPLFQTIDFSTSVSGVSDSAGNYSSSSAANVAAAQIEFDVYTCPMDGAARSGASTTSRPAAMFARSSYSGVTGIHWEDLPCATLARKLNDDSLTLTAEPCQSPGGAFYVNSRVRLKEFRDGTSQTIILAETSDRLDFPIQAFAPNQSDSPLLWGGTYWATVVNPLAQDHVLTATIAGINNPNESGFSPGLNSRHPGRANAAFADGSIRFLSDQIDSSTSDPYGVLQRLSTIAASDVAFEF